MEVAFGDTQQDSYSVCGPSFRLQRRLPVFKARRECNISLPSSSKSTDFDDDSEDEHTLTASKEMTALAEPPPQPPRPGADPPCSRVLQRTAYSSSRRPIEPPRQQTSRAHDARRCDQLLSDSSATSDFSWRSLPTDEGEPPPPPPQRLQPPPSKSKQKRRSPTLPPESRIAKHRRDTAQPASARLGLEDKCRLREQRKAEAGRQPCRRQASFPPSPLSLLSPLSPASRRDDVETIVDNRKQSDKESPIDYMEVYHRLRMGRFGFLYDFPNSGLPKRPPPGASRSRGSSSASGPSSVGDRDCNLTHLLRLLRDQSARQSSAALHHPLPPQQQSSPPPQQQPPLPPQQQPPLPPQQQPPLPPQQQSPLPPQQQSPLPPQQQSPLPPQQQLPPPQQPPQSSQQPSPPPQPPSPSIQQPLLWPLQRTPPPLQQSPAKLSQQLPLPPIPKPRSIAASSLKCTGVTSTSQTPKLPQSSLSTTEVAAQPAAPLAKRLTLSSPLTNCGPFASTSMCGAEPFGPPRIRCVSPTLVPTRGPLEPAQPPLRYRCADWRLEQRLGIIGCLHGRLDGRTSCRWLGSSALLKQTRHLIRIELVAWAGGADGEAPAVVAAAAVQHADTEDDLLAPEAVRAAAPPPTPYAYRTVNRRRRSASRSRPGSSGRPGASARRDRASSKLYTVA